LKKLKILTLTLISIAKCGERYVLAVCFGQFLEEWRVLGNLQTGNGQFHYQQHNDWS